jgi:hypothetical protein
MIGVVIDRSGQAACGACLLQLVTVKMVRMAMPDIVMGYCTSASPQVPASGVTGTSRDGRNSCSMWWPSAVTALHVKRYDKIFSFPTWRCGLNLVFVSHVQIDH